MPERSSERVVGIPSTNVKNYGLQSQRNLANPGDVCRFFLGRESDWGDGSNNKRGNSLRYYNDCN